MKISSVAFLVVGAMVAVGCGSAPDAEQVGETGQEYSVAANMSCQLLAGVDPAGVATTDISYWAVGGYNGSDPQVLGYQAQLGSGTKYLFNDGSYNWYGVAMSDSQAARALANANTAAPLNAGFFLCTYTNPYGDYPKGTAFRQGPRYVQVFDPTGCGKSGCI